MPKTRGHRRTARRATRRLLPWTAGLLVAALFIVTACADSGDSKTAASTGAAPTTTPEPEYPLDRPVTVTADNFVRAETDREFAGTVAQGGFGAFHHNREPMPVDHQTVVRPNRDTLYSSGVFDLDAGPVSITLPDAGKRFLSMQVITEDEYNPEIVYRSGTYTYDRDQIGTRYVMFGIRIFADPNDPADIDAVHRLQDQVRVQQAQRGVFQIPQWDQASQDAVRSALLTLAATLPDTRKAFGPKGEVDEVRHLLTAASAWGGNPDKDALYLTVTPPDNTGTVDYTLHVEPVPVDGFWSVSLYNAEGYYVANPQHAYSINNVTAATNPDGSVDIRLGGCDGQAPNCLPTMPGWNYMVRLYRPQPSILDGQWVFPAPQPIR